MKDRKLLNSELGRVTPEGYASLPESGVVVVLDNVRSALNVGSVFRSCDAFKVDKVFLCGISAVPPSAEIHKSALGAEDVVPWEYCGSTLDALAKLRDGGYGIFSVEQTERPFPSGSSVPDPEAGWPWSSATRWTGSDRTRWTSLTARW